LLLSDAKSLHINGKSVKEAWMGGKQVWAATPALPYTPLEYIQTRTGTGGYLINYTPPYNAHLEFKMAQMMSSDNLYDSSKDYFIIDAGYGCRMYYEFSRGSTAKSWLTYALGASSTSNIYQSGWNILTYDKALDFVVKDTVLSVNGYTGNASTQKYAPTKQLMICENQGGTSAATPAAMKIYEFKIFDPDTGELIIHLIPVLKNEDNKPYLYDLINDVYYSHSGTTSPLWKKLA
jgi:hypothetical protein